ncbi:MAG TPA: universal stress protein [Nitrososphaeraceae archaeon]
MSQTKSEFSKILIAVDGSQSSMNAADRAVAIAKKETNSSNPQQLFALYVVFSRVGFAYSSAGVFGSGGLATPSAIREILEGAKMEAQQWFDKIKEKINIDNNNNDNNNIQLHTDVVVSATSIVAAIVEYAKNKDVDLIVIGTRGRSGFKKLLLGSVASGVIINAACPVMVVK